MRIVYDVINRGQQREILENESVKQLFDLYGVLYSE